MNHFPTAPEGVERGEEIRDNEARNHANGGSAQSAVSPRTVLRVFRPGQLKFQLRRGEAGISVFDPDAVFPPLIEAEVLQNFRTGSQTVKRSVTDILAMGLQLTAVPGDPTLPFRLQAAHAEIRPGPAMSRSQFKAALQGLE